MLLFVRTSVCVRVRKLGSPARWCTGDADVPSIPSSGWVIRIGRLYLSDSLHALSGAAAQLLSSMESLLLLSEVLGGLN